MLASCRSEVCEALGIAEEQCELSMGMSGDFELAVSEFLVLTWNWNFIEKFPMMVVNFFVGGKIRQDYDDKFFPIVPRNLIFQNGIY